MIQKMAEEHGKDLLPTIVKSFRDEKFNMGDIGLLGSTIKEYGCANANYVLKTTIKT